VLVFQLKAKGRMCGIASDPSYPNIGDEQQGRRTRKIDVDAPIAKVQEIKPAAASSTEFEKPAKDLRNLVYRKTKG